MLESLGIGETEEAVYRLLIARRRAGTAELTAATGRSTAEVRAALAFLVEHGLADAPADGVDADFVSAPPGVALNALLRQRQDDLRQSERAVAALQETIEGRRRGEGRLVGGERTAVVPR